MLFWKIFAIIDVLINLGYWRAVLKGKEQLDRFDAVSIPIGLVGTAGLITYAFSLPTLPGFFWLCFLPIFVASAAWEIASAANKSQFDVGTLIGVALAMLIAGLTSVALYRLAGSAWIGILGL